MNEGGASYLPPEWWDDERMRVLMAPMPPLHDAVASAGRHVFWSSVIHQWCRAKLRPTFTVQECELALRRRTQTPRCLPEVLQHMYNQGELIPLSDLLRGLEGGRGESWGRWGKRVFVTNPAHYAWGLVRRAVGQDGPGRGLLVDTVVLKELCDKLLNTVHHHFTTTPIPPTTLLTLAHLYALTGLGVAGGSADTLRLLVDTLAVDGRARTAEHRGTTYVKFLMPGDLLPPEVTEMELAESELNRAQSEVEGAVRKMTEETEQLRLQARGALQSGSRVEALSLLRRKKRLEKSLTTQLGALENVSTCLQQLQHSRLNRQVLGAFRVGVEALRMAVGGVSSPEGAATTLDELQQVLEDCEDVSTLVSGGGEGQQDGGEEADLQAELDRLMDSEQQQRQQQEPSLKLPDVPKSRPVVYGLPDADVNRTPEMI